MHRYLRSALAAIALISMVATFLDTSATAASLRELQQRLQANSRNIKEYQTKLRATKRRQHVASSQVILAQRRLGVHRARLSDIRGQLSVTRAELARARTELALVEARLKKRRDLLSVRLVDTYKHGTVSYAGVLLGSEDFWDLLSRGYVLRRILDSDVQLVQAIKEDKVTVEAYERTLAHKEQQRVELERQQTAATQATLRDARQKQYLLQQIEKDRAAYEQALAEFQKASAGLERMIRRMQATPAGRKRVANPWRGSYACPISASYRISSRFGWRTHPVHGGRSFHTGVDLACPGGTGIRAAAGGVVIHSGWYGVYGNTVIIDHGGGVSTVYAHCSSLRVSAGASVKQGQTIAGVGSTGLSTGPHLHYELRKNGTPQNPL